MFLTTEGFIYCGLALLDLLAHVIPAASVRLGVFKPLDILTGAHSCFRVAPRLPEDE